MSDRWFVQISDSRRNAFEGEIDPGLALVERDDIREGSRGVNFPERLKSQLMSASAGIGRRAFARGKSLAPLSTPPAEMVSRNRTPMAHRSRPELRDPENRLRSFSPGA